LPKKTISDERKLVIKSLVDSGMSYREVQKVIPDVSMGAISKIAKQFESNRELVEFYKNNRADLLADLQRLKVEKQHLILKSLTEEEIAGMKTIEKFRALLALDTGIGIDQDKERLERGESTENVSIIYEAIVDLQKRRAKGEA